MKRILPLLLLLPLTSLGAQKEMQLTPNWSNYFNSQIAAIEASGPRQIINLSDWNARRGQLRQELAEMLGLWPMPERTDLNAVVTGTLQHEEFKVEMLHFQAAPRLYVTANLYLPANLSRPAPGALYVCGHSRMVTNNLSLGNKTAYQHHGAWFARNGFVCLVIDTLQYGEIMAAHRGTYSDNQWWWNSRGYTPAGIEAWFGIRALDYLCSRPEVDPERIGMTGRSGGGAYTWAVSALDERVKVAAPIAGMTDLRNHVLDGKVDGHCDCMFHLNTYRWDFPMIGALIAPRPLLIGNTDNDRIFPLDGVLRVHEQIRHMYQLYGRDENLGLVIAPGDHEDTQELQVPVFRWFIKHLRPERNGSDPIAPAVPFFAPDQLRVFAKLPEDERNTTAADWFNLQTPEFRAQSAFEDAARDRLREKCFAGWPAGEPSVSPSSRTKPLRNDAIRIYGYDLAIQPGITQQLYSITVARPKKPRHLTLLVADDSMLKSSPLGALENAEAADIAAKIKEVAPDNDGTIHLFVPRAVGDELVSTPEMATRLRRRFMLVGQTLDSMRVWDIRCAAAALRKMYGNMPITVVAAGKMAVNASYAALFQSEIGQLHLSDFPKDSKQLPDYLNSAKVIDGVPAGKGSQTGSGN